MGALWTAAYLLAGAALVLRRERRGSARFAVWETVTAIALWPVTLLVVNLIVLLRRRAR